MIEQGRFRGFEIAAIGKVDDCVINVWEAGIDAFRGADSNFIMVFFRRVRLSNSSALTAEDDDGGEEISYAGDAGNTRVADPWAKHKRTIANARVSACVEDQRGPRE